MSIHQSGYSPFGQSKYIYNKTSFVVVQYETFTCCMQSDTLFSSWMQKNIAYNGALLWDLNISDPLLHFVWNMIWVIYLKSLYLSLNNTVYTNLILDQHVLSSQSCKLHPELGYSHYCNLVTFSVFCKMWSRSKRSILSLKKDGNGNKCSDTTLRCEGANQLDS